jgi:Fe-S oxidoreductase
MCNNNGECRKLDSEVMCPSYRVTGEEIHLTRGRANTLRLAVSGQLGPEAMTSEAMRQTLDLCVSCKGCRRECPTGIDMARMKIEVKNARAKRFGLSLHERLIAYLPRYARIAASFAPLLNLRNRSGLLRRASEFLGFSARRALPKWRSDWFDAQEVPRSGTSREVVLFVDTFTTYFEPENARAALKVLQTAGYQVIVPIPVDRGRPHPRPLCCGRTFLAEGLVDEARAEAKRMFAAVGPYVKRGVPVVGLEPSCLFSLKDEFLAMLPGSDAETLAANAFMFEEFLAAEARAGTLKLPLKALPEKTALVHGHCHQKAFAAFAAAPAVLKLVPGLEVKTVESSCCGMAGSFGYEKAHYEVSLKMAELSLLPAVRAASADTVIVADGTSCRHQIRDGAAREAIHVARLLERALA